VTRESFSTREVPDHLGREPEGVYIRKIDRVGIGRGKGVHILYLRRKDQKEDRVRQG
jgi:hypothetical protein